MSRLFYIEVSEETYRYLEARAARNAAAERGPVTVAAVAADRLDYARRREEALARDDAKERAIRAAGAASGEKRKRYQPRHADARIADPATPQDVRAWAEEAPVAHPEKRKR